MENSNTKRIDHRAGKPLSEARKLELQVQRKNKLNGLSPRKYAEVRDRQLLRWVWKWGFSSKAILQKLSTSTRHGIVDRLVKKGLFNETKTASGSPVRCFYTLTESGLAEIERHQNKLHQYSFLDPHRVRQNTLRHEFIAQDFTLVNALAKKIKSYETVYTLRKQSTSDVKEPDSVWIMPGGEKYAIEIELTKKWERDFDEFRRKVVFALCHEKTYSKFYLVTDSKAIEKAYKEGMKPGTLVPNWKKDANGKWKIVGKFQIPDEIGYGADSLFLTYLQESK